MLPDQVSNPGPLTYESGALPIALRGAAYFCWLPSHAGIKGNEKADIAAKSAITLNISDLRIPLADFKHCINTLLRNKCGVVGWCDGPG